MRVPEQIAAIATSLLIGCNALAADKIKIGYLSTLSGPAASIGTEVRDGFNLGIKHAGGKLGGLPVELTIVDDQQRPETARPIVERFIRQQRVDLITGIIFSNVLLPILPAILDAQTFYVSPNTGPKEYAGEKCHPYFFAAAWQNEDVPGGMGKFATDRKINNVYLIAPNYPGGRETLDGFKRHYRLKLNEEVYVKLGQLDFAVELAAMRAAKPDAVFPFLPGGMGINFVKQFFAAGMSKDIQLLLAGFQADEDVIQAVGDNLLGAINSSHWAHDLDNAQNKRFVADYQKEYSRLPNMFAAQGYDTAMLIDAAVRDVKGRIEDKDAFRRALRAANFKSVRGPFKFNKNHFPIHNLYLRIVHREASGRITNRTIGTIVENFADPYVGQCKMAR